jgi:hypothetical protein
MDDNSLILAGEFYMNSERYLVGFIKNDSGVLVFGDTPNEFNVFNRNRDGVRFVEDYFESEFVVKIFIEGAEHTISQKSRYDNPSSFTPWNSPIQLEHYNETKQFWEDERNISNLKKTPPHRSKTIGSVKKNMWKYNNRWVSEIHTPDCKFCFNNNEEN